MGSLHGIHGQFGMSVIEVEEIVCRRCRAALDVEDNFCRLCGAATREGPTAQGPDSAAAPTFDFPPTGEAPDAKLRDNRAVVLAMLFAVLGPLAIPMLWRSARFSRAWKIALTVLVAAVAVMLVWLLCWTTRMTLAPLREFGGPAGFH